MTIKHSLILFIVLCSSSLLLHTNHCTAQTVDSIPIPNGKFITGDDSQWKEPSFDDSSWKSLRFTRPWQSQGYNKYSGYAWYRIHIKIPSSLKHHAAWKDSIHLNLAHVNDVDETFINGVKIGKTGRYPEEKGGFLSQWQVERNYGISTTSQAIKWDEDNVIAVRVYGAGTTGGIFMGAPYINMFRKLDGVELNTSSPVVFFGDKQAQRKLIVKNKFNIPIPGVFKYVVTDQSTQKILTEKEEHIVLTPFYSREFIIKFPHREGIAVNYSFKEVATNHVKEYAEIAPYLLTPLEPNKPSINGAAVFGVHKGSPISYKIPVSGKRPLMFNVKNLPAGLTLNKTTGIITGQLKNDGDYNMVLSASNSLGTDTRGFTIKAGKLLALTPPMGWNSWNCWGLSVSDSKVRSSAAALLNKGLADYGWANINIDDGWEGKDRAANGEIVPNDKFPDMKSLGDYLHNAGLRFGIYSSPGRKTCGGFLGTFEHEAQDASTYNNWGIDYLKYDLCSYLDFIPRGDTTLASQKKPYIVMQQELHKQPRDITYSLCQYGYANVWTWGPTVDGNLWRTTGDIEDTWKSLLSIGFRQDRMAPYTHPGGWNDADMLIVGMLGWGEDLHPTRLNPYEQYTHISLWCMLSAPLLIGCDMSRLDDFTLNLLKNKEVLAIDQDELGKGPRKVIADANMQVWIKELVNGDKAIGIFNLNSAYKSCNIDFKKLGIDHVGSARDLWSQKNILATANEMSFNIPPHGVKLIRISSK